MLKQMLSEEVIDNEEAYEFSWVGKKASIIEANKPIKKTLRPFPNESVNWKTTENLYIEGDNLEVLKLLQESYLGTVKLIYIDPPYNTGNDFVYIDDFKMSVENWNAENRYVDSEGNRMYRNTDSNGRFHSDWCSMIYSRLILSRNLLSDDGLIFISIGDEEVDNLKKMCDEVFGADNFRNQIVIRRGAKSVQAQFDTWDKLGKDFEYILLYSKISTYRFPRQEKTLDEVRGGTWNNHWRGTDRPTMRYPLLGITPESGQWRWSKERSDIAVSNYQKMIIEVGNVNPSQEQIDRWYEKQPKGTDLLRLSANGKPEHYIPPTNTTLLNSSWMDLLVGSSSEINALFDTKVFDTAKLSTTIRRMLNFTSDEAIVLDFFSGSGTTAQAVMQANAEDSGHRKFIMIQIPEKCDERSEAFKAGYRTICDIGKERIRRAAKKIAAEYPDADFDGGFRVFKLDESNMNDVYYAAGDYTQDMLAMMENNIKPDRTSLDLLFGCLLEWGLPLSLLYTSEQIEGCMVHNYNDGDLIACFDENIPDSVIREIAKRQPLRAVFRDSSFNGSPAKINVGEIFKMLAPDTRLKVI
ncbi:site-specific DNA-methyltransferase [uncultured Acinetobacter sp.]|uniref:site-specific DNA-methyltransferase n=1 Tax=uncultured Acinetobacter sp. TaxID=165433 RepID=UPI002609B57B|nr:site-specific DNA-methyltransferase [uncultured Acinetobacter sp.]